MTVDVGLVPFREHHADIIKLREQDCGVFIAVADPVKWIKAGAKSGPAYTLYAEGKGIIAIGGIVQLWTGVADVWAVTSPLIEKFPKETYKATREMLDQLEKTMNLHRIQTSVLESFEPGHRWIKRLGFHAEGLMENYGPKGENFRMYARVRI